MLIESEGRMHRLWIRTKLNDRRLEDIIVEALCYRGILDHKATQELINEIHVLA